ncbi:glycosyl transferase group 1 [Thermanaerovibrio velox DSM 12556]|uniref:Glycosyl transferase group 1 n=2 Tax=Thermanaerovibrio TaxID=81461 RepID=H0UMU6_9BACT|nr:glycosyl transferase group 1 [Thermanaerovibrio velox DSM 12556]
MAFLPEIDAYIKYFNEMQCFEAYDSFVLGEYSEKDFDVIWEFKGLGGSRPRNSVLIHEYASLSTGLLPKFKNLFKTKINPRPDLRVFLNNDVMHGFGFNDGVEFCLRDMGIDESFLIARNSIKDKEYDFVYVGPVSRVRGIDRLLSLFSKNKLGKICLIGNVDDGIYSSYKNNKDIIFVGRVPYSCVPEIAAKAVYGINFIPNKYPYNIQTSTKLLEYLALGLKIITTDYKWLRLFEKNNKCNFYKISDRDIDINIEGLKRYNFVINFEADRFIWKNIIHNSGIEQKILKLINETS